MPNTPISPTPASPDSTLVTERGAGNTGWILAMVREQKEATIIAMEAQNERLKDAIAAVDRASADRHKLIQAIVVEHDVRYEQRFMASEKAVSAAIASAGLAVSKAEASAEKRFEGVNEFRATLADQQRMLMPRSEAETQFRNLAERVETNSKRILENTAAGAIRATEAASRGAGVNQGWAYALGVITLISILMGIISVVFSVVRR